MSYTRKNLEELNIMDDFLMNAVASDGENGEEFCRLILSTLLEREIGSVRVTVQRTIPPLSPSLRGIRMDVEVLEEPVHTEESPASVWNIYDLEPHIYCDVHLPRHNRFYQARIDSRYLRSGERDFLKMPNLYMITITPYDPFGYDHMVYRIRNQCEELPDMPYEDGIRHFYFYTKGRKGGTPAIRAMLDYFQDSRAEKADGEVLQKIHQYVSHVKILPEVKDEFMHLEQYLWERIHVEVDQIRKELEKEMAEQVTSQVTEQVTAQVTEQVTAQVTEQVTAQVTEQVTAQVTEQVARETELRVVRECQINHILELLEDSGEPPASLKQRLLDETDPAVLKKWLKLAAKSKSFEEFEAGMQLHKS